MAQTPPKRPPPSLKIKCKSETPEAFLKQFGQDISTRGVFVKTKKPLKNGTALRFEFQLADATPAFAGVGKVVWRRETSSAELPAGMGIEFTDLQDDARQVVERVAEARIGMMSRFDQQNDAEIDPAALLAARSGDATPFAGSRAPSKRTPALPQGLLGGGVPAPSRGSAVPAAGLFSAGAPAPPPAPPAAEAPPPAPTGAGLVADASEPPMALADGAAAHDGDDDLFGRGEDEPTGAEGDESSSMFGDPDGSGMRPTPLPEWAPPGEPEPPSDVLSAGSLDGADALPTDSLDEEDTGAGDSEDLFDAGAEINQVARLAAPTSSFPPAQAQRFNEVITAARQERPTEGRPWVALIFIVVLALAAIGGFFAFQSNPAILDPVVDWIEQWL